MEQFPTSKAKLETWQYVRRRKVLEGEFIEIRVEDGRLYFPKDCSLLQRFQSENLPDLQGIPF